MTTTFSIGAWPWVAWLLLALSGYPAAAQDADKKQAEAEALNSLYADFSAPDLTAPTLLGVNTSQVSKPANVRALAGSLLGAAVATQQQGGGLGVEVAPALLLKRPLYRSSTHQTLNQTLADYRYWINRIGRGTTLSGASLVDSASARIALGMGVVLVDHTDPLLDAKRTDTIISRFRTLAAIRQLNATVQGFQNSSAERARAVYAHANLPTNNDKLRRLLLDSLLALVLLPNSTTLTALGFQSQRQQHFARWNARLDSLGRAPAPLTTRQLDTLRAGAIRLRTRVEAAYPLYIASVTEYATATQAIVKQANDEFAKRLWNATIAQVGGGLTWRSTTKSWRNLDPYSGGVFARAALRPASRAWVNCKPGTWEHFCYYHLQVVLLAQYGGYHVPTPTDPKAPIAAADSLARQWTFGGRLLVGGAWLRLSGEYAYQYRTYTDAAQARVGANRLRTDLHRLTLGSELRLADKLWLEFAFGTEYASGAPHNAKLLTLASLKYALRTSQRFKTTTE